ncbi:uncharacterized protein [Venturia canescens]|uniref:uncharacterized protein n=1 Tax=Venturia canescens TaxID=32260 RepID=UPI001C9C831C|nr:uncharacterized protein LOC122408399 [Venturia canescens]
MSRETSILNISTLGLVLLLVSFCDSKIPNDPDPWINDQEAELHPSVISGIRKLEYIRRLMMGPSENRFDKDSRFFNGAFNSREKIGDSDHLQRQVNSTMFEALSKLAKVRVADPSNREALKDRNEIGNHPNFFGGRLNRRRLHGSGEDERNTRVRVDPPNPAGSVVERPKLFNDSGLITRKFQCSPISEIYIPDVDKQMPAYLCALGRRAFVILSERFNQESRDRFIITLDDQTYRQLNPIYSGTSTLTSAVSVLPATLVLKRGDADYTVRGVKDSSKSTLATNRP